jgi:hypothetical protein
MSGLPTNIADARKALDRTSTSDRHRLLYLSYLSTLLCRRAKEEARTADLDEAILLSQEAVELTPQNSPRRHFILMLALAQIEQRYIWTEKAEDRNQIIEVAREIIVSMSLNEPSRAQMTLSLGLRLFERVKKAGLEMD